jgi:hypothetical protein
MPPSKPILRILVFWLVSLMSVIIAACGAAAVPVIPTPLPTATTTYTPSPSRTPGFDSTPTARPTSSGFSATGGPSPTPLFGPTRTPVDLVETATRPPNPNAPRIEFFTSDVLAVAPGQSVTLFWSTRNVTGATIYRVDQDGVRSQLWNVPSDGNLIVPTRRSDRGEVNFVLSISDGPVRIEEPLILPLSCPDAWFFEPPPQSCPQTSPIESRVVEQEFERGRMLYIESSNRVYALFNDGLQPAWVVFENRYDPARDPESEENFVPPPGFVQPLRQLGFVWRGNDLVRNRLGLGTAPDFSFDGFTQAAILGDGSEDLYVSSADSSVLELVPGGESWQIITTP